MGMTYNFTEQNNKSFVKEAEKRCCQLLTAEGKEVIDVSNNSDWYARRVDIIATENNKRTYIDVKADTRIHETGRIFYELIECFYNNAEQNCKMGWAFNKLLHFYIYYVDVVNWKLYKIKLNDLTNFVYNKQQVTCKLIPHDNYKTMGFVIPLEEIRDIVEEVDLNVYDSEEGTIDVKDL